MIDSSYWSWWRQLVCTLEKGMKEGVDIIYSSSIWSTVVLGTESSLLSKDGDIVSDGTIILGRDDKAVLAVMLETLKVLKKRISKHGTIEFIITVGEESGLIGAKASGSLTCDGQFGFAL